MLSNLYIGAAVLGGVALLFQFVLMLTGLAGDDGGHDVDLGSDPGAGHIGGQGIDGTDVGHHGFWFFEMLSLRTISAAVAFFGMTGQALHAGGAHPAISFCAALAAGYGAMYCVYWVFKQLFRLETSGNEDIRNAVGLIGQVYVAIPGASAGRGKVTLKLQNRIVEYDAVTDEPTKLASGEPVVVVDLVSSDTVKVARASQPSQA